MLEGLSRILLPDHLPTFAYVLARVTGLLLSAPLWSLTGTPRLIRVAVAVVLTLALIPACPAPRVPAALVLLPLGLAAELLIGLTIGLTAAVIVHGAALAGEVISLQMGLSLGPTLAPMVDVHVPGVGQIQSLLALMVYIAIDGHLMLLRGVAQSFTALPPGAGIAIEHGPALGIHLANTLFLVALQAAAPAMVALFLIDLAVGFANRAVPQLHAVLVLFPIAIITGLIMLWFSVPTVTAAVGAWMAELPDQVTGAVAALTHLP